VNFWLIGEDKGWKTVEELKAFEFALKKVYKVLDGAAL
jgi:hypothetical protein